MLTEAGRFNAVAALGNQTITLRNANLTPKVIILWSAEVTGTTTASVASLLMGVGFAIGVDPAQYGLTSSSQDNVGTSNANRAAAVAADLNGYMFKLIDATATNVGVADFVSFSAGSVVIDWTTAPAATYMINYLVFGGSDISVATATVDEPDATGAVSYTGLGFNPTDNNAVVMLFSAGLGGNATNIHADWTWGIATSTTQQGVICGISQDNRTTGIAHSIIRSGDRCFITEDVLGDTLAEATFNGWVSDGFSLNWTKQAANTRKFAYLVISGATFTVTDDTITTSGTTHTATGLSYIPGGFLLLGSGENDENSESGGSIIERANNIGNMGAATEVASTGQTAITFRDGDNDDPTEADSRQLVGSCWGTIQSGGAASGVLTLTGFNAAGATFTKTAPAANSFVIFLWWAGPTSHIPIGRESRRADNQRSVDFYTRLAGSDRGGQRKRLKIFDRNIVR